MITTKSFKSLHAALANPAESARHIRIGADIPILEPITIPHGKFIEFGQFKFLSRGKPISFDGSFDHHRRPVFSDFNAGEITGSFGASAICPEWWGLQDGAHDIAINAAIRSCKPYDTGHTVSLASGIYYVRAPLDLRTSRSYLHGASSGSTKIMATSEWDGNWESSGVYGISNHSAMIWIGGNVPGVQTFRTGVKGVEVNAWHASHSHPGRYVSCLSSTGGVEENTVGEDLLLSYFTGFGVGFSNSSISTVNGLSLRNFWITGAMGRNSVPLYCPMHAGVMSIRDGTVDVRVSRGDAFTWPAIGIVAGGAHTVLDNLHIEGCGTAIYVEGRDAPTSVDISSIATNHLMEPGMTYFDEPFPELPPPTISEQQAAYPGSTDPWLTKYSSAVIIGRHPSNYQSSKAYNVTANIRTVRNLGRCKYLLRDHLYGEHYTPFGKGQYPNSGRAVLPPYSRGEGFIAQPATATFPYPDGTGNASTRNNLITN